MGVDIFGKAGLLAAALLLAAAPPQAADLAEIYELAVQNDPQLGAAESSYLARREVVDQGRSGLLPSLNVTGYSADNRRIFVEPHEVVGGGMPGMAGTGQTVAIPTQRYNTHGWQARLQQPIFRMDSWYRYRQARSIRDEARAAFAAEQQALLVRVADSYFSILEREALLTAARAERDAVSRQLEQVQQRFEVGLVAVTDVLEAQAAYDDATARVIEAEGAQSTSFEPLLRLTGTAYAEIGALDDGFPIKHPDPADEEEWVKAAIESSPALTAARARLKAARQAVRVARSERLPKINAEMTYSHNVSEDPNIVNQFGSIAMGVDEFKQDNQVASLNVSMPLFQGGAINSGVRQAKHELDAAQQSFDLQLRQVVENTRNLYTDVSTDVARVQARRRNIESSRSALEATETGYEVGTRNIVDVLQAQQRLYLSHAQYASARYQYVRDTLRLKQMVGVLSPADLLDLNDFIDGAAVVRRNATVTR